MITPGSADRPVAVVTGASSGIGAATARALGAAGFAVVLGARRVDRCAAIAAEIDGTALRLDVTDQESVDAFVAAVPQCRLLVNNAGGAKGLEPVAEADVDDWRWMFETNVLGTLRMTRALLPALVASGDGHVVTITSVAGAEIYDNGAGYCAASTPSRWCTGRCGASCSGSRCGSPRCSPGSSRPTSRWSVSTATPSGPRVSTAA